MIPSILRILCLLLLSAPVTPVFAHGAHGGEGLTPVQHVYAHIGGGWMILVSMVVVTKLVLLFTRQLRRSPGIGE